MECTAYSTRPPRHQPPVTAASPLSLSTFTFPFTFHFHFHSRHPFTHKARPDPLSFHYPFHFGPLGLWNAKHIPSGSALRPLAPPSLSNFTLTSPPSCGCLQAICVRRGGLRYQLVAAATYLQLRFRFFARIEHYLEPGLQAPKRNLAAAIRTAICPIQKRNIHLMISALMSAPSCFVMSRFVRSNSCSRKAISRLSAIARALGGSIWAASRIESIFVVLTRSPVIRAPSRCQITNSPSAVCWLLFAVCAPCPLDR